MSTFVATLRQSPRRSQRRLRISARARDNRCQDDADVQHPGGTGRGSEARTKRKRNFGWHTGFGNDAPRKHQARTQEVTASASRSRCRDQGRPPRQGLHGGDAAPRRSILPRGSDANSIRQEGPSPFIGLGTCRDVDGRSLLPRGRIRSPADVQRRVDPDAATCRPCARKAKSPWRRITCPPCKLMGVVQSRVTREARVTLAGRMMAPSRFQRWCEYGSVRWRGGEAARE